MKRVIWTLPLIVLGACSNLSPTEDPVYLRLNDIEARLLRMERVFENESLIQMAGEVNELQSEIQQLRGQVETLQFEGESQAERQRDLYVDIDERLQALEQSQSAGAPPALRDDVPGSAASGARGAQAGGSPEESYNRAFELIQARQYEDAAAAFSELLESFPESSQASNAQYWLAETYYVRSRFDEALPEFQRVMDDYPRSSKVPDALLKIGYCNYELQNWDEARNALRQVQREFPDTTAARLASQRLDDIEQEAG